MNPITKLREQTGMSRKRFALLLGVSYPTLGHHETGYVRTIQPAVYAGIERLGFDADKVAGQYGDWIREQEAAALKKLASR